MEAHKSVGGLVLPDSLAGRLEERLLVERLICNDFHRLETFLAGMFETVQVLDADAKRCVRRALRRARHHLCHLYQKKQLTIACGALRVRTDFAAGQEKRPRGRRKKTRS